MLDIPLEEYHTVPYLDMSPTRLVVVLPGLQNILSLPLSVRIFLSSDALQNRSIVD